jgi:hypothetical protein
VVVLKVLECSSAFNLGVTLGGEMRITVSVSLLDSLLHSDGLLLIVICNGRIFAGNGNGWHGVMDGGFVSLYS